MSGNLSTGLFRTVLITGVFALFGCHFVPATQVSYYPRATGDQPPKSRKAEIPILNQRPAKPHVVIGSLYVETVEGWEAAREKILYTARRSGADAVYIRGIRAWEDREVKHFPATTEREWVSTATEPQTPPSDDKKERKRQEREASATQNNGYWNTKNVSAHTGVYTTKWLVIYAEMIAFK
jgi:hypothetical protein